MMKHVVWLGLPLAAAWLVFSGGVDNSWYQAQVVAAPPLSLEGLMDEKLPEAKQKVELLVDNSACYVCHGNLQEDALVIEHGKEGTGCMDCHGESLDHRNDEDNITPPDKMYPPERIDAMCKDCHDEHNVAAVKVIARWQKRCPEKKNPKEIVCTNCHFSHRLALRTVIWDKKTGKLLNRHPPKTKN